MRSSYPHRSTAQHKEGWSKNIFFLLLLLYGFEAVDVFSTCCDIPGPAARPEPPQYHGTCGDNLSWVRSRIVIAAKGPLRSHQNSAIPVMAFFALCRLPRGRRSVISWPALQWRN